MTAMAGDLAGFEEAAGALFAGDQRRFSFEIELWPVDMKNLLETISAPVFD